MVESSGGLNPWCYDIPRASHERALRRNIISYGAAIGAAERGEWRLASNWLEDIELRQLEGLESGLCWVGWLDRVACNPNPQSTLNIASQSFEVMSRVQGC